MGTINFKKYFKQNKSLLFAGIAVAVAGALLYGINYFFVHEWVLWQGSVLTMVAGIVIVICHFSVQIRDGAVDDYVNSLASAPAEELEKLINETEKRPKKVFEFTSGGYEFSSEDAQVFTIGNDNAPRCEKYFSTVFAYTSEYLYAAYGKTDLLTGKTVTDAIAFHLSDITSVNVKDESFTKEIKKKTVYLEQFYIVLKTAEKEYRFTVHNDAMTDQAFEKIERAIKS